LPARHFSNGCQELENILKTGDLFGTFDELIHQFYLEKLGNI